MKNTISFVLRIKRYYSVEDINILKEKLKKRPKTREIRKTSKFGACNVYEKPWTIDNPFLHKYKRFEPKKLRHYQIHFIIEHGFLPKDMVLSHRCHRKVCVQMTHIICESCNKNGGRNGCKTIFEKCGKRNLNKCFCKKHIPC